MQTSPAVDGLAKRQMWELLEAALLEVHATFMQHVTIRCKFVEQSARRIRKVATRCIVGCNPMHCWLQHDKLCTAPLSACASSCPLWRCATFTGGVFPRVVVQAVAAAIGSGAEQVYSRNRQLVLVLASAPTAAWHASAHVHPTSHECWGLNAGVFTSFLLSMLCVFALCCSGKAASPALTRPSM